MDPDRLATSAVPPRPSAVAMAELPSVDWWITSRCNLSCDFCFGPAPRRDPAYLREAILEAIESSSAVAVTFCGGEPLLVREIDRYAKRLLDQGKRTILNTNGSLLARRLGQNLARAFAVVGLSIDGSTDVVHRAMRGVRADLEAVLRAAELVAQTPGVSLKLATVVSAVNRADLPSLASLVGRLKPDIWRLYQYSARGVLNVGQHRHTLSEDEFHALAEDAAAQAAPVPTSPSSENLTAGCLIIDPDGNVLLPAGSEYVRHGNCLDEPIDKIWARIPAPDTIIANKRWHSVIAQQPARGGGRATGALQ